MSSIRVFINGRIMKSISDMGGCVRQAWPRMWPVAAVAAGAPPPRPGSSTPAGAPCVCWPPLIRIRTDAVTEIYLPFDSFCHERSEALTVAMVS
jgi:hypothetical protein